MRINRLSLKNLNSLRGEFRLDFDETPLAEAGIFAITGPTGAGKTTILDAICVALYGQTPRLAAGSSAELLSRNTGECFAEVEFTVGDGRYRSRWSRRRARGRTDGALQPTAMELVEIGADGERIIEDQVRAVIERVEALTGLDFGRFTRSVLLAQGSFASFLKAKENERAELLERMTGTRIYSLISITAYKRAEVERHRLDELVAVNALLDLIPPERLAELEAEVVALEVAIASGEETLAGLRTQEATASRLLVLGETLAAAEAEVRQLQVEQAAAEPDLAKLALAEAVRPLQADLRSLDDLGRQREVLLTEAKGLAEQGARLRREEEAARAARTALTQEVARFAEAAGVREGAIQEAERLDQQLRHQEEELAARRLTLAVIEEESKELTAALTGQHEALALDSARATALDLTLQEGAVDAGLGHDLSRLAEGLRELAHHRERFTQNRRERERVGQALARLGREAEGLGARQELAKRELTTLQTRLAAGEATLAHTLQGRSPEEVELEVAANRHTLARLTALLGLVEEKGRSEREFTAKDARHRELIRELAEAQLRRERVQEERNHAEALLALMEERELLAARVATYEDERRRLQQGAPCPVCGSLDHPWSEAGGDRTPAPDQARAAVVDQRRQVHALVAEAAALESRGGERERQAAALAAELLASGEVVAGLGVELGHRLQEAGVADPGAALTAKQALERTIEADLLRLAAIRKSQTENEALLRQLMALEKGGATLVVELEKAQALIGNHQADLARGREEEDALCRRGAELAAALTPQLSPYGVALPAPGQEEAVSELLRRRWQQYDQAREERAGLESRLAQGRQALAVTASQLDGVNERLAREGAVTRGAVETLAALGHRRSALLGEESPDSARARLAAERGLLDSRLVESERQITSVAGQLATQAELLRQNGLQGERLTQAAQGLARTLVEGARGVGLADLEAVRRALLPDPDFQALLERREAMTLRRQRLQDRVTETRLALASLGPEAAGLDREAITEAIGRGSGLLAGQQQELGARREQIRRHHELAAEHRQRSEVIARQRLEQQRWQLLSDLIGSADGKKFRRFAQGLTLDHLIALANRQLVRLSDRYLLRRHPGEELGLEIMDTYQADAIRPTGTLSGGEEFLVSLALALGLANLSGQTRIDSLFLDEGFGTLDTETLETALAALVALQETGKTIGIISHVDALKERIPVQIRLQRLSGGFSTLAVNG